MKDFIWKPEDIDKTKMMKLIHIINESYNRKIKSYEDLHSWSVENISEFWEIIWDFSKIIYSKSYTQVVDNVKMMPGANWFIESKLNFAENLMRFKTDNPAIYFKSEFQSTRTITYNELYNEVKKLAHSLKQLGLGKGDRVAGYIPNIPEAVSAMLATSSLGAIWSSCSPDFGIQGVLDRFIQIKPKIIFTTDGYNYNGKCFDLGEKLKSILKALPTVEKVIVIKYTGSTTVNKIQNTISYNKLLESNPKKIEFEQLPFSHPLYIMYTSGTTGLPKSIVHSAGGTLIQHLKELQFHCDMSASDVVFYFTTTGWMMWNWLISSLSIGATIVLYDGSPSYPNEKIFWNMIEELGITIFGTSAKYIDYCKEKKIIPSEFSDLSKLRLILSTGSPLIEESYDYVYKNIKNDVHLASISGGTDIISCFVLGNPILPVKRGELQCKGLGMDVHSFNESGQSVINEKGELVCMSAFPSMPVYFWNDKNDEKYMEAYFSVYPGYWHHGDFIRISKNGASKIYGRSDATLNPGGVRIGTSEIYRVVESIDFVKDSLVIGQKWNDDQRIILFVILKSGFNLNTEIKNKIKQLIKIKCSPRHVPKKIIKVKGIPYTINGKKVEVAVKKIIEGGKVDNLDALDNPKVLEYYENIPDLRLV
tara:strand:- start:3922 stop:5865 length:1944 start_codon:yes stop_codon:yes gene_type:complete